MYATKIRAQSRVNKSLNIVTIFNDSEYELLAGRRYLIEIYGEQGWMWIVSDAPFTSEGLLIRPHDFITLTKNLIFSVGTLSAGQYRIRKSVFRIIDVPITADDHHDLIAAFQIN